MVEMRAVRRSDQVQQCCRFEFGFGEEIVDTDLRVRAADAVDAAIALHEANRVPGQVVVDNEAAVLKILAFGENVRADENADLLFGRSGWWNRRLACCRFDRRDAGPTRTQAACNRSKLSDDVAAFVGMVAAINAANMRASSRLPAICHPLSAADEGSESWLCRCWKSELYAHSGRLKAVP